MKLVRIEWQALVLVLEQDGRSDSDLIVHPEACMDAVHRTGGGSMQPAFAQAAFHMNIYGCEGRRTACENDFRLHSWKARAMCLRVGGRVGGGRRRAAHPTQQRGM